jgi:hypothetical protein
MGKMLAGSIERLLDSELIDKVSDEFLRVGNKELRFVLPGRGPDSTSFAYWMRETLDRSLASTGTEACESITSSICGTLGLFGDQSLTSCTNDEVQAVEVIAVVKDKMGGRSRILLRIVEAFTRAASRSSPKEL